MQSSHLHEGFESLISLPRNVPDRNSEPIKQPKFIVYTRKKKGARIAPRVRDESVTKLSVG